jgi:hypothetical protein
LSMIFAHIQSRNIYMIVSNHVETALALNLCIPETLFKYSMSKLMIKLDDCFRKMQLTTVLLVLAALAAAHAQNYYQPLQYSGSHYSGNLLPPPVPIARAIGGFPVASPLQQQQQRPAHRDVVATYEQDSYLPEHLKNPFYKNPRIAQALAKESWRLNGEEQVFQREAEKIPRQKVFSILKQAGFI